jgi:RNA polymerase sigma factor (sigma-70 family)
MQDAMSTSDSIRVDRLNDRQVADRYLNLSRLWVEKLVSKAFLKLVDSEQLASETVLRLILWMSKQSEESYLQIRDLDCICRTIAKRVAIQAIRDARRFNRTESILAISLEDYLGEACTKSEVDPQQIAMHHELVQKVLKGLHPSEAMILELRLSGWTNSEIGHHTGVSARQIQSKFIRIKTKLSKSLKFVPQAARLRPQAPQDSGLRTQDSGLRTQDSALSTQHSALSTQD